MLAYLVEIRPRLWISDSICSCSRPSCSSFFFRIYGRDFWMRLCSSLHLVPFLVGERFEFWWRSCCGMRSSIARTNLFPLWSYNFPFLFGSGCPTTVLFVFRVSIWYCRMAFGSGRIRPVLGPVLQRAPCKWAARPPKRPNYDFVFYFVFILFFKSYNFYHFC